jgi:hypothetical protein
MGQKSVPTNHFLTGNGKKHGISPLTTSDILAFPCISLARNYRGIFLQMAFPEWRNGKYEEFKGNFPDVYCSLLRFPWRFLRFPSVYLVIPALPLLFLTFPSIFFPQETEGKYREW